MRKELSPGKETLDITLKALIAPIHAYLRRVAAVIPESITIRCAQDNFVLV